MRVKIFSISVPVFSTIYTGENILPIDKFVYLVKVWKTPLRSGVRILRSRLDSSLVYVGTPRNAVTRFPQSSQSVVTHQRRKKRLIRIVCTFLGDAWVVVSGVSPIRSQNVPPVIYPWTTLLSLVTMWRDRDSIFIFYFFFKSIWISTSVYLFVWERVVLVWLLVLRAGPNTFVLIPFTGLRASVRVMSSVRISLFTVLYWLVLFASLFSLSVFIVLDTFSTGNNSWGLYLLRLTVPSESFTL